MEYGPKQTGLTTAGTFGDDGILDGDPSAIGLQLFFGLLRQLLLPVLRSAPSPRAAVKAQKREMTLLGGFARHASREAARSLLRAGALAHEARPKTRAHVFP